MTYCSTINKDTIPTLIYFFGRWAPITYGTLHAQNEADGLYTYAFEEEIPGQARG
jgi:hypothetical protein